MAKLFEVDFRNRSTLEKVNGSIPTNSGAELVRGTKGICSRSTGGLWTYPSIDLGTDDYSIIIWCESVDWASSYICGQYVDGNNRWFLRADSGTGFQFYCRDTTGVILSTYISFNGSVHLAKVNGQPLCIQLNIERGVAVTGYINQWAATVSLAADTGRAIPVGSVDIGGYSVSYSPNTHIYKAEIHSGKLTEQQMADEYQLFLHSSPTSTASVIRHHVPVDPTGSVLCHDYQNWRGGIVPDLSGNGNSGNPVGFVDCGIDGARFDGSSYLNVDGTGDADPTQLTIEALFKVPFGGGGIIYGHRDELTRLLQFRAQNDSQLKFQMRGSGNHLEEISYSVDVTKWIYGVAIFDKINNLHKLYVNGVDRGTDITDFGVETFTSAKQTIGGVYSILYTVLLNGLQKFVKVSPYALTEAKIQANWNEIANQAIFNEPMFNELPDNRSYTAGQYLENWYVSSGTFTVKEDSTGTYIECTGNGVIQYKGIDFSMYKENGFIKKIVGDISSDQGVTVDTAVNVAFASNVLSVTLTTGQKLYELVITKGEEV